MKSVEGARADVLAAPASERKAAESTALDISLTDPKPDEAKLNELAAKGFRLPSS